MKIKHATKYLWSKEYKNKDILSYYLKSDQKKIQRLLDRAEELKISYSFETATEKFFTWFQPFYESRLSTKENAIISNIIDETVRKPKTKLSYTSLTIYQDNKIIGGCIFSDRGEYFSIAYRAFDYDWQNASQVASPSIYAEYLIDNYSIENGKKKLIHGRDRHPYGLNSNIGLAIFKLSVGCKPLLPKDYIVASTDSNLHTKDILVFELPEEGPEVKTAHLILKANHQEKYLQLLKFKEIFDIKVYNEYE